MMEIVIALAIVSGCVISPILGAILYAKNKRIAFLKFLCDGKSKQIFERDQDISGLGVKIKVLQAELEECKQGQTNGNTSTGLSG